MIHPPPLNPLMFPDRCILSRRGEPVEDQPGSVVVRDAEYSDDPTPVACAIHFLSANSPDLFLTPDGRTANIRVSFPSDPRLLEGDVIREIDAAMAETGRGFLVVFQRRVGRAYLRYWDANCLAWQVRR